MSKLRRKTVSRKRKARAKRPGMVRRRVSPAGWFFRAVNLPYRPSREIEQTIEEAVERLT